MHQILVIVCLFYCVNCDDSCSSKLQAVVERLDAKDELITGLVQKLEALEDTVLRLTTAPDTSRKLGPDDNINQSAHGQKDGSRSSGAKPDMERNIISETIKHEIHKYMMTTRSAPDGGAGVSFFATLTNHAIHEGENQAIPFDNILTNVGNAYDGNAGVFTAPFAGVYVFSVSLQALATVGTPPSGYAITKNGQAVGKLYLDGSTPIAVNYETAGMTAVLQLNGGDKINVVNRVSNGGLHGDQYSSFCGFLVASNAMVQIIGK